MKKLVVNLSIILFAFIALSCDESAGLKFEGSSELEGEWLLFETGGSPGAGYFIEPVSAVPSQTIEFKSNGEFSCSVFSVSDLNDCKFYSVRGDIVGLFKSYPGPSPDSLAFTHSYRFSFDDCNLKLQFRFCDEGCHLGFKKLNDRLADN